MIDTCLAYSEDQICGEAWWFKEVCGLRRRCRVPRHSFDLGYLTELPIRLGSSLRIVSNAGQLYIYIYHIIDIYYIHPIDGNALPASRPSSPLRATWPSPTSSRQQRAQRGAEASHVAAHGLAHGREGAEALLPLDTRGHRGDESPITRRRGRLKALKGLKGASKGKGSRKITSNHWQKQVKIISNPLKSR